MKTAFMIKGFVKIKEDGDWEKLSEVFVPEADFEKVNELFQKAGFSHYLYTLVPKVIADDDISW